MVVRACGKLDMTTSAFKGDHRHFQGIETAYVFTTVEKLMADFWADVRSLRGGK